MQKMVDLIYTVHMYFLHFCTLGCIPKISTYRLGIKHTFMYSM